MPPLTRQISPAHKKRVAVLHSIGPAVGATILWCLYVLKAVFHIDPDSLFGRDHSEPAGATLWLIFALVGTVGLAGFAAWQINRALDLARRGIEVVGTVSHVSKFAIQGLVQVECKFHHRNRMHTHKWSMDKDANVPEVGDKVNLIVDRHNPRNCMQASDVLL